MHGLRESVTAEQIENAASILVKANVVHVAAQHRSFPRATYLTYALSHLSVRNILLDSVGGMFYRTRQNSPERRCCTGREFFSLRKRSPQTGRSGPGA